MHKVNWIIFFKEKFHFLSMKKIQFKPHFKENSMPCYPHILGCGTNSFSMYSVSHLCPLNWSLNSIKCDYYPRQDVYYLIWRATSRMGELDKSLTVRKKSSTCVTSPATTITIFLVLPDNLVISNCCKLSSTATKPSDFVNILISCIIFQPHS